MEDHVSSTRIEVINSNLKVALKREMVCLQDMTLTVGASLSARQPDDVLRYLNLGVLQLQ